ncbi:MAG TPA: protein kinase [Vicinamibacterales bacterium]|nr:protein kinase [Vicinamibacterales bacterium]
MAIDVGTRLGSYEITSFIGEGGMGRVFRARDTRLRRDVAIKLLPEAFANDSDRIERFRREAQALAALRHVNIAGIHDLVETNESRFLVLELVEGETLANRIAGRQLPWRESIIIAAQVAEALEAAHDSGIVHRDLKPANIKIAPEGTVKVLDFGLAKIWEPALAFTSGATSSPTSIGATMPGTIMGTAPYMSPEQARGQTVDRAADVWALACVVYEMLAGRRPFAGDTAAEICAAILRADPEWEALPADVPPSLTRLLRRCLEKDRRRRLRDAGAVLIELREIAGDSATKEVAAARTGRWPWAVAAVLGVVAVGALGLAFRPAAPAPEIRLDISTPPTADELSFALSPDGRTLAFVATIDGEPRLWLRSLDSVSARPLDGTAGASYPFWSPDSSAIAFFADNKLKRVDVGGGPPQTLTDTPPGRGGTWSQQGVILYAPTDGPLRRVPDQGGETMVVTRVEAPQQSNHRFPHFLPDGSHFLFYVRGAPGVQGVHVGALDGSAVRRLLEADAAAAFASGYVFFVRQGTLFAQSFDVGRLELAGSAFPVAEHVAIDSNGLGPALSVSGAGAIAYRTQSTDTERQMVWVERSGAEIRRIGSVDTATPFHPELSPDGRQIAVQRRVNGNQDIWLLETARGILNPFTFDAGTDDYPVWSPDARFIAFQSNRSGAFNLYRKPTVGDGAEELLFATPNYKSPTDWSRDGQFLLFRMTSPETGYDVWALPMDRKTKPFPVVQTNAEERDAQFSPDGQWIAYQSNESGRFEIYVQSFPKPLDKWRISTSGGAQVRWCGDASELFFLALDGRLMAVPIRLDSKNRSVDAGTPVPLFRPRIAGGAVRGVNRQQYAVSTDGRQFLVNVQAEDTVTTPVTLILNWKPKG